MVETYFSMHNHSYYSFQDGYASPKEYLEQVKKIGLKGFAISEHGNQCSWVYFDELKKEYPEIKMVYGCEVYECLDGNVQDSNNKYYHLLVLARNEEGRKAINWLVSESQKYFYYKPRVDLNLFRECFKHFSCDSLVVSSACLQAKLSREKDLKKCIEYIKEYKELFPHFYLEMQSHSHTDQAEYNQKILTLAITTKTPYIITTDSHAATKEDLYYQARHVQIAHDSETMSESYEGCYLQTVEEIHEIMDSQIGSEAVEQGLQETLNILDMCDIVNMPWQSPQLPDFPIPSEYQDEYEYLRHLVYDIGWYKRKLNEMPESEQIKYKERMEYELSVIKNMNFIGYFLIVWDFINWAKSHGVKVGAGRGSCSGSLVNFCLEISSLDPLKYNLIFERFLNPERVDFPDIDTDFNDRDAVIRYKQEKYGYDKVAQVINYSYITNVVAIRDAGKILKIPFSIVQQISKKFNYDTWEECMAHNPDIMEEYPEYYDLFDIASHLSNRVRQASIHAGGVIVSKTSLSDYMGTIRGGNGEIVIQLDKRHCEPLGLIKFDLLGVASLNVIQDCQELANISDWELDPNNPDFLYDKAIFDLIATGRTNAVFQIESAGMKDLVKRIKPKSIEELSDILALYRPDAMPMLEDYVDRITGVKPVEYWCDEVKHILEPTYGCLIYQEETMQIVKELGNRTYGGADRMRKCLAKKIPEKVKEETDLLRKEMKLNGYSDKVIETICEFLDKMGGYSFNHSHSICYAVLTMQTAYLKAHYPLEFFTALLKLNENDYANINKYILDAKSFGVEVVQPNINESNKSFKIYKDKIMFGLLPIVGVGEKLTDVIIEERNKNGKFKSIKDFISRVDVTKAQVVNLIKSGALPTKDKKECLIKYAKSLFTVSEFKPVSTLPTLKTLKEKYNIDTDTIKDKESRLKLYNDIKLAEYNKNVQEKYERHMNEFYEKYLVDEEFWEFATLSIFINNNPFDEAYDYLTPLDEVEPNTKCVIVGVIAHVQKKKDKNKNDYAYLNIYSSFGITEVTCWASQFKRYDSLIKRGNQVTLLCDKKEDGNYFVSKIKSYQEWLADIKRKR